MKLFQKALTISFFFHLVLLLVFALALPNRQFQFHQLPVELAPLPAPEPPPAPGFMRSDQVRLDGRTGPDAIRIYLPAFASHSEPSASSTEAGTPIVPRLPNLDLIPEAPGGRVDLAIRAPGEDAGLMAPIRTNASLSGPASRRRSVYSPLPRYPNWARERGVEAYLELKFWVEPNGSVRDVEILKSSGYPDLDLVAVGTIGRWRFEAEPVQANWAILPLRFQLR
ncbi:MAG TPA: energy transducer TonB [bacterium]|uniref:Gram-negative bacterial tonB protein n=1 Tax=candidate division TA06 bacterium ADurb.Bin417 TaxID=1852828 RepID=A0A1V5MKS2_UNCT6|nr:MAG: Gram-negative bacterial tonB protein [candidate division TA06 bacterium ADurb.Bin417]HNQ35937.1 energy transducer TonB [bacterium]HNS48237.1 energy transducer TonB [bacterium]